MMSKLVSSLYMYGSTVVLQMSISDVVSAISLQSTVVGSTEPPRFQVTPTGEADMSISIEWATF